MERRSRLRRLAPDSEPLFRGMTSPTSSSEPSSKPGTPAGGPSRRPNPQPGVWTTREPQKSGPLLVAPSRRKPYGNRVCRRDRPARRPSASFPVAATPQSVSTQRRRRPVDPHHAWLDEHDRRRGIIPLPNVAGNRAATRHHGPKSLSRFQQTATSLASLGAPTPPGRKGRRVITSAGLAGSTCSS